VTRRVPSGPLPWQLGVPPVTVEVDCQGERHRVTWRRGKLVLEDHHLGAEEALVGLGGDRCACLELLGAWRAACRETSRLVLPAGGGRPLPRPVTGRLAPHRALPAPLDRPAALSRLVRQQRHWVELAAEPGGAREALFRRLLAEFRDAVAASLLPSRQRRTVQRVEVKVRPLDPRADPTLEIEVGRGQVRLAAELPVSWLVQVWGWDLAAVEDGVVLEVLGASADGSHLAGTLLRWEEDQLGRVVPVLGTAWLCRSAPRDGEGEGDQPSASEGRVVSTWRVDRTAGPCPHRPLVWWSVDVRP
jgi:hypothetical protein